MGKENSCIKNGYKPVWFKTDVLSSYHWLLSYPFLVLGHRFWGYTIYIRTVNLKRKKEKRKKAILYRF